MSVQIKEQAFARYYRLALICAKDRDLSKAAEYARYALKIEPKNERAAKLLGLCLYELGELNGAVDAFKNEPELAERINMENLSAKSALEHASRLVKQGKLRRAGALLDKTSYQSIRILNVRGCLCASCGKYAEAAGFFAKALEKDRANELALKCLAEAVKRRKVVFGVWIK